MNCDIIMLYVCIIIIMVFKIINLKNYKETVYNYISRINFLSVITFISWGFSMMLGKLNNSEEKLNLSSSNITGKELTAKLKESSNIVELHITKCDNLQDLAPKDLQGINLIKLKKLLIIRSSVSGKALAALIKAACNVNKMNVISCNNLQDLAPSDFQEIDLSKLESSEISISNMPGSALLTLLKKAINLEFLKIWRVNTFQDLAPGDLQGINLSKLKTLILDDLNISGRALMTILETGSNLELLNISNYEEFTNLTPEDLQTIDLSKLKKLQLFSLKIRDDVIAALLKKSNNIEELYIRDVDMTNLTLDYLQDLKLKNLKKIQINDSKLSAEIVYALLKKASNVEELILENNRSKNQKLNDLILYDFTGVNLRKLKKIRLFTPELSSMTSSYVPGMKVAISALLKSSPNIEELDLRYSKDLQDLTSDNLKGVNLNKLTKIDLNASEVSVDGIIALLKLTPNIEELNLRCCDLQKLTSNNLQGLNLSKLKKLNLNRSNISAKTLIALLKEISNIEDLDISGCPNLQDLTSEDLQGINLSTLEKIDIDDSNISGHILARIIHKSNILPENSEIVIKCFQKFTSYHVSIGFIVRLLVDKIKSNDRLIIRHTSTILNNTSLSRVHKYELIKAYYCNGTLTDNEIQKAFEKVNANISNFIESMIAKKILFTKESKYLDIDEVFRHSGSENILKFIKESAVDQHSYAEEVYERFKKQSNLYPNPSHDPDPKSKNLTKLKVF